jgi:hypothetical protein
MKMNRWVWVFGEIEGLRWVLDRRTMAFPEHAARRVQRLATGDRAVLYVTRGAFHNPTRDRAHLAGVVTVTSPVKGGEPVIIAGQPFTWFCNIDVDISLPEREGPEVHHLVEQLELVRRPEVWGQYFRQSPIAVSEDDFRRLEAAVTDVEQR